jgi:hypothetical protein
MDLKRIFSQRNCRRLITVLFLASGLLAMPLAFKRIFTGSLQLWPVVNLVTMPVMTLFSLGIILIFPENVKVFFHDRHKRWLWIAAGGFLLVNLWHWLTGGETCD